MPSTSRFREVMGHFATGVTVVTSRAPDGAPCGLTANSVASVSLDPLMLLVCLDREAATLTCVREGGRFCVCVLEEAGEGVARLFSEGDRVERFEELTWREEVTGAPVLDDALAWLDCRVRDIHDGGDHAIVVGEVQACDAREGSPLLYFRGRFRRLPP